MIRLVLVDDHTLVRHGIRQLLELTADIVVVGEAADGDSALRTIVQTTPEVVLLDVRMPRMSGVEVLKVLQGENRLPPTILLTTFDDDEALFEGVRNGARGFLLKDVSFERLTDAIRRVAAGETLILPAVTERSRAVLESVPKQFESLASPESLTRREIEVLRFMAGGYSNREVADVLGVSEGTVKNHVSSILSKLGVRDRTRAVLRALELRWI
ncbi:nitrate/nitrite response regulator protein [Methylocaldum marinum]|uniref:Nitrate/nitrite response regulator protein n=1 Tax=Methylocaldum marinum TaxID=1432792 RepID=A0A250KQ87_9GAMM|nr:response regulator transcription factor [Methylocaldum marinum]BBA33714.1 nitrate/nitrite response regulator protein [Methylocaldum marinum]